MCGLRAQATDQHREEAPPSCIRESRTNPATLDVDKTGAGETGSLVGSFPEARLVLGEGAENPCVRRRCPEPLSGVVVRSRCPEPLSGVVVRSRCPEPLSGAAVRSSSPE